MTSFDVSGQAEQLKLTILATRNLKLISNYAMSDKVSTHVSTTAFPSAELLGTDSYDP